MVRTSVTRPPRGRFQRDRAGPALLLLSGLLRRRAEPGQFLVFGHGIALADEEISDLGAFLVGADDGLAARHDEAGHAHLVGEAGIGGFGDDDLGLALAFPSPQAPVDAPTSNIQRRER